MTFAFLCLTVTIVMPPTSVIPEFHLEGGVAFASLCMACAPLKFVGKCHPCPSPLNEPCPLCIVVHVQYKWSVCLYVYLLVFFSCFHNRLRVTCCYGNIWGSFQTKYGSQFVATHFTWSIVTMCTCYVATRGKAASQRRNLCWNIQWFG